MLPEERTRFEVLLERIETNVKVIAEGHVALVDANRAIVERLDRMETKLDVVEMLALDGQRRLGLLETRFDGLEARFDGLEARFDGLETKVDGLETRFDGLEAKVDGIDAEVKELGTKVDIIETVAYDGRERLIRIEHHLELKPSRRGTLRKPTKARVPKRHKKT